MPLIRSQIHALAHSLVIGHIYSPLNYYLIKPTPTMCMQLLIMTMITTPQMPTQNITYCKIQVASNTLVFLYLY
jgi:hypothetical protein